MGLNATVVMNTGEQQPRRILAIRRRRDFFCSFDAMFSRRQRTTPAHAASHAAAEVIPFTRVDKARRDARFVEAQARDSDAAQRNAEPVALAGGD